MIGDFNATQHSRVYEQLRSGRAALGARGSRPRLRDDLAERRQADSADSHRSGIFVAGGGVRFDRRGHRPGSDHKPLILDLRVHSGDGRPESAASSASAAGDAGVFHGFGLANSAAGRRSLVVSFCRNDLRAVSDSLATAATSAGKPATTARLSRSFPPFSDPFH